MPNTQVIDLRNSQPQQYFSEIHRNLLALGSGDILEARFKENPRPILMGCMEQGLKYVVEQANDHWKLRVNGIDFHPMNIGIGLHSIVGEARSPLLAACDRRETFYLVHPGDRRVAQTVNIGGIPSHVTMDPAGNRAMVANFQQGTVVSVRFDGALAAVTRGDTTDPERTPAAAAPGAPGIVSLAVGRGPHLPQFSGDGRYVCATGSLSGDVAIIDAAAERVLEVIPVGPGPHDPVFSPDGEIAFIPVALTGDLAVVAMGQKPRVVRRLQAGDGASHIAVSEDGSRIYVANSFSGDVTMIRVTGPIDQWGTEAVWASGAGAHVPELTPDGRTLVVANFLDDTITLFDTATGHLRACIPVGYYPHSFGVSPDGQYAVIACWGDPLVYIIDVNAARLAARIPGGMGASHVAFSPDGGDAFVGNSLSDSVTVINLAALNANTIPGGRPLFRKGSQEQTY